MYIIQEIQTNNNVSSFLPAIVKVNKDEAESAYHMILASAAISAVQIHTAMMFNEYGEILMRESYTHNAQ